LQNFELLSPLSLLYGMLCQFYKLFEHSVIIIIIIIIIVLKEKNYFIIYVTFRSLLSFLGGGGKGVDYSKKVMLP
jgi:hypothetical protein